MMQVCVQRDLVSSVFVRRRMISQCIDHELSMKDGRFLNDCFRRACFITGLVLKHRTNQRISELEEAYEQALKLAQDIAVRANEVATIADIDQALADWRDTKEV